MRAWEFIREDVSIPELNAVEKFADTLWSRLGIDVEFSRHFLERVNNERNGKPISAAELVRIFKKEYEKYGKVIAGMEDPEAVMKDAFTKINLPFALNKRGNHQELVAKTVMRKDNFRSPGQEYVVQEEALPKNNWVCLTSNSAKEELGHELIDLVNQAYSGTQHGSFVNSLKDVMPSDWAVIDWDDHPDVDAAVFYRGPRATESWTGYKIQGIGHDGQQESKRKAVAKVCTMLNTPGVWIESSDAMRKVLQKMSVPVVSDEEILAALFGTVEMVSDDTYRRQLSNGTEVIETVFGNPIV